MVRRWGNLPADDAMQFGHEEVVRVLKDYQKDYKEQEKQHTESEHPQKLDTIEGMVWHLTEKAANWNMWGAFVQSTGNTSEKGSKFTERTHVMRKNCKIYDLNIVCEGNLTQMVFSLISH